MTIVESLRGAFKMSLVEGVAGGGSKGISGSGCGVIASRAEGLGDGASITYYEMWYIYNEADLLMGGTAPMLRLSLTFLLGVGSTGVGTGKWIVSFGTGSSMARNARSANLRRDQRTS